MPEHIRLNQGNDIASVVALLKNVQNMSSRQQTSNSGSFFIPADDEWESDEEGSFYGDDSRPGIVTGDSAADFGGIARKNKNGELEPLVDTESITNEVNEAKQNAQSAVDSAVNALTAANSASQAAGSANDVANAANANSTEAKSVATQAVAAANSATQSATSAKNTANLALQNAQELVVNGGFETGDLTGWTTYNTTGIGINVGGTETHSGEYMLSGNLPTSNNAIEFLSQSFPVVQGRILRCSGWFWNDARATVANISIKFSDGSLSNKTDINSLGNGWHYASSDVTVPSGVSSGRFRLAYYHPDSSTVFTRSDDISVKDITEAKEAQDAADSAKSAADTASSVATQAQATAASANQSATSAQTAANLALANAQNMVMNTGNDLAHTWGNRGVTAENGVYERTFPGNESHVDFLNGRLSGKAIPGHTYSISFDARVDSGNYISDDYFQFGWNDNWSSVNATNLSNDWQRFATKPTVYGNGTDALHFYMSSYMNSDGAKVVQFRNLSIKDITEVQAAQKTADSAQATADAAKSAAETNTADLTTFINETTDNLSSLQSQVDGSITTWFYDVAPTTSNKPASDWTTTDMKNNHLGDLYYDTDTGYCYRWQVASNAYSWSRISDVDVTKALSDAASAQDTADSKRRVFTGTPSTPYDVGDLWVQGASGDILRCGTAKTSSQSYNTSDWVKASRYTDDTLAGQANQAAVTAQESASTAQSAASTAQSSADAAKTAAESAQTTANAAVANAGTALTNANQALARATHITTGATAPTQNVETGDVWFPTNTAGNVIGMKTWGGSAWTDVQLMAGSVLVPGSIGSTVIADGAITTPKLTITEEMVAELLKAKKIEAGDIDLNTLNGQTINGLVVNGATVRTASSGTRVDISNYKPDMEGSVEGGAIRFFNSKGNLVGLISVDEGGMLNIMTGQFDADGKPDPEYYANIANVFGTLTLIAKNGVSFSTGGGQMDLMRDGSLHSDKSIYINNNEVASQSGWVGLGYGSGYKKQTFGHIPRIMRMGNVVFAQGTALKKSGNIAADDHPFGTIPVGYRPDATQYATVTCAGNHMANIQINTNGTINLKGAPTGGTPWLTLDSCVWQTADSFPMS